MPFFVRNKGVKRKNNASGNRKLKKVASDKKESVASKRNKRLLDNDVESESSENEEKEEHPFSDEDELANLTLQETKVRLARKYLDELEKQEREKVEDETESDIERNIEKRLKEEELFKAGKLKVKKADYIIAKTENITELKCKQHKLCITCVIVSSDNCYLYSSSKDISIVKWSLLDKCKILSIDLRRKKKKSIPDKTDHHNTTINCLAISNNNKFLVSGDENGIINVWNPNDLSFIHTFKGHKTAITGLAICKETNFLYSGSKDSLVKVWTLNELSYVETLFGHQAHVTSVDILFKDRVVTSGGFDKTVRVWKIQEESQLVFNGHQGSIDRVKRIDNGHFVSCGDDGTICIWSVLKKKPLLSFNEAHGIADIGKQPNWISSICGYPNSDLIASGSCDGYLRLWKCSESYRSITPVCTVPVIGYINDIIFTPDEKYIIIAVGKEHRFGRWNFIKEAKNSIICIPLEKRPDTT